MFDFSLLLDIIQKLSVAAFLDCEAFISICAQIWDFTRQLVCITQGFFIIDPDSFTW